MRNQDNVNEQLNTNTAMSAQEHRVRAQAHKDALKAQWKTFLKTGIFVIAIVVIAALVFAWFVNTQENHGHGMSVKPQKTDVAVSNVTAFSYEKDLVPDPVNPSLNMAQYTFQKTEHMSQIGELVMSYYDGITEENSKTPIILRCRLTGKDIDEKSNVSFFFETNLQANWQNASGNLNRYLSNITNIRCAFIPYEIIPESMIEDESQDEAMWQLATNYLKNNATAKTFVELPSTKQQALTFNFTGSQYDLTSDNSAYFYFLIDYDRELILEYVKGNSLSGDIGMGGIRIDFENDFTNLKVDTNT